MAGKADEEGNESVEDIKSSVGVKKLKARCRLAREFCRDTEEMENAEMYASANGMQRKDAKEVLAEFRDKLKWGSDSRILDIGCGSGEVTTEVLLPLLPKDFNELIGLDISLEMIQHARNLHSHPKVSFIQFDIAHTTEGLSEELESAVAASRNDNLETPDIKLLLDRPRDVKHWNNSYDVVTSFYCLHWVTDQRLAIRNIHQLLRPGGEALLVFLAKSPIFTLYRKLSTLNLWKEYMQDVDSFIPYYQNSENPLEKFTDVLKDGKMKILNASCRERSYAFESATSLRNAIKAVNPFLPRIPNHLQEEFINECIHQTKILKLAELKNNSYKVNYKLIVAHVRKPS